MDIMGGKDGGEAAIFSLLSRANCFVISTTGRNLVVLIFIEL